MKNKVWMPLVCGVMMLVCPSVYGQAKSSGNLKVFPGNDPHVEYIGRTAVSNETVAYDWTGVHFRTQFTGGYLAVKMSDTRGDYFDLFIDGNFSKSFRVTHDTLVVLAGGLSAKRHTAMLYKRTEGEQGTVTVSQFMVAKNGSLGKCDDTPVRHIEFIGNSITCGFGTEVSDPKAPFLAATEDSYHGYASIVSRYFDADYHLIAHSGLGVVRNYGDKNPVSDVSKTMRRRFFQTFDMNPAVEWNFDSWKPDVVVVKLGTNDLSNPAIAPTEEQFTDAYLDLIASVRKAYGQVPVVCVTSCMAGDKLYQYVQNVVEKAGDKSVYFVGLKRELLDYPTDFGACAHPNYAGQKKMASVLIPYLSTIMHWPLADKPIR
jgi:lysophospholipase L1-like esterase